MTRLMELAVIIGVLTVPVSGQPQTGAFKGNHYSCTVKETEMGEPAKDTRLKLLITISDDKAHIALQLNQYNEGVAGRIWEAQTQYNQKGDFWVAPNSVFHCGTNQMICFDGSNLPALINLFDNLQYSLTIKFVRPPSRRPTTVHYEGDCKERNP